MTTNKMTSYLWLLLLNFAGAMVFVCVLFIVTNGFPKNVAISESIMRLMQICLMYFFINLATGVILKFVIDMTRHFSGSKHNVNKRDWFVYLWSVLVQGYLIVCLSDFNSTYSLVFMLVPISAVMWYLLFIIGSIAVWFKRNFRMK